MLSMRSSRRAQRGVTLTETLLVLGLAAVLAAAAYRAYTSASNDAKNAEQSNGAIALVGKIKQVWGTDGNYESLDPVTLYNAGILPAQFRFIPDDATSANSAEVRDAFGNPILLDGYRGSFALTFGNLSRDGCTSIATAMASVAYRIEVGPNAQPAEDGEEPVSIDNLYKSAGRSELNTAAMLEGCGSEDPADRTVVVQIR